MKNYDYKKLIEDAEFEVKYYSDQYNKAESNLFRARLALEALHIRVAKQTENELALS